MIGYRRPLTAFALLILVLVTGNLPAQVPADAPELPTLNRVLPPLSDADKGTLLSEGQILRFHPEGVSPGLLPETGLTGAVARQIIAGDLNIGIEGLFFTKASDIPSGFTEADPEERKLILYNILRSVSTLQGMEYYSASRDEMRVLFEESWAVADEKSKDALPDPLVEAIPYEDTILVYQKDGSFGKNTQLMNFRVADEAFASDVVNITPMRYKGIFKVVDPGNMQIHLIVVPVQEGLLVYGTMSAHTKDVKAFLDRAQNSFTNRVVALSLWYKDRLIEEFR